MSYAPKYTLTPAPAPDVITPLLEQCEARGVHMLVERAVVNDQMMCNEDRVVETHLQCTIPGKNADYPARIRGDNAPDETVWVRVSFTTMGLGADDRPTVLDLRAIGLYVDGIGGGRVLTLPSHGAEHVAARLEVCSTDADFDVVIGTAAEYIAAVMSKATGTVQ